MEKTYQWDEGVFSRTGWLYDLRLVSKDFSYIHVPLLLLTRIPVQQELYAKALTLFPEFIGCKDYLSTEIIDGSVVRYFTSQFESFRQASFNAVINVEAAQTRILNKLIKVRNTFPERLVSLEKSFANKETINPDRLIELHDTISICLALNLAAPFFEIAYLKMNKQYQDNTEYQEMVKKYLFKPVYSNIMYYSVEIEALEKPENSGGISPEKLAEFVANIAFLENPIGDGSEYENFDYLCQKFNLELPEKPALKAEHYKIPDHVYDPAGIADELKPFTSNIERTLALMRSLQINEEFRHYWGIRLVRLFRNIAPDDNALYNWYLKDYEKYLKK